MFNLSARTAKRSKAHHCPPVSRRTARSFGLSIPHSRAVSQGGQSSSATRTATGDTASTLIEPKYDPLVRNADPVRKELIHQRICGTPPTGAYPAHNRKTLIFNHFDLAYARPASATRPTRPENSRPVKKFRLTVRSRAGPSPKNSGRGVFRSARVGWGGPIPAPRGPGWWGVAASSGSVSFGNCPAGEWSARDLCRWGLV